MSRRAGRLAVVALVLLAGAGALTTWSWLDRGGSPGGSADGSPSASAPPAGSGPSPSLAPSGPADPRPSPTRVGRLGGGSAWLAPASGEEARLRTVAGPVPASLRVDALYPVLRPGDVRSAVLVVGVVEDTSLLRRLLVLDEGWQLYELDLTAVSGRGGPLLSAGSLSPDGRRIAFGRTGEVVLVDLRELRARRVHVGDTSTRGLRWVGRRLVLSDGTLVARVASVGRVPGFGSARSSGPNPSLVRVRRGDPVPARYAGALAIVVDRPAPAALLLDGDRPRGCCAIAGRAGPGQVLYESRDGALLHLLSWDTGTGRVHRVATIRPVVGNDWYALTSYRRDLRPPGS